VDGGGWCSYSRWDPRRGAAFVDGCAEPAKETKVTHTKYKTQNTILGVDGWDVAGGNHGVVVNGEGSEGRQTGAEGSVAKGGEDA
jgi:hypothetical protein